MCYSLSSFSFFSFFMKHALSCTAQVDRRRLKYPAVRVVCSVEKSRVCVYIA